MRGHDKSTCSAPNNGRGKAMTVYEQNVALENSLVVKIGLPGKTCLPKTLEEFEKMKEKCSWQTKPVEIISVD